MTALDRRVPAPQGPATLRGDLPWLAARSDGPTPLQEAQARLDRLHAHVASLRHELAAMEALVLDPSGWRSRLAGQRLVYVGGRPGNNAALRALVQQAGGEFVVHAGLVHDDGRAGGLAALLPGTARVLCPLDLIDPESLDALRHLCPRHGVPWQPLRSASVASFVAGLVRMPQAEIATREGGRFCLRHG